MSLSLRSHVDPEVLKNYLTIALRNIRKYPAYSLINISGLAIGLSAFILIMLFVRDEMSYERHHDNADDIYRLVVDIKNANDFTETAQSATAWGPDMQRDYGEVKSMVRMKPPNQKWMIGREDLSFYEKELAFVDSTIFDIFTIPLVRGNPETALEAPFKMVISEEMAAKYFAGEDPIGKTITLDNQYDFEVTAIMQDMPSNSHFRFGFLPSISSLAAQPIYGNQEFLEQHFPMVYTYLLLHPGTDAAEVTAKFPEYVRNRIGTAFRLDDLGIEVTLHLQPLTDIHLHSARTLEIRPNGDIDTVYIFIAIAVFILLIASINFMNLATARSASRALEVGLRKVVGAGRGSLIGQFLGESVVLGLIALVFAILPVWLALPQFNAITGKDIGAGAIFEPGMLLTLLGMAVLVGVLAGSYPALFLSAFKPATVLKGELRSGSGRGTLLRKGLIVFQFMISIGLIVATGIVYEQMAFASSKKLGFDKEHVVIIELTDPTPRTQYRTFRQILEQDPDVISVSGASSMPAGNLPDFQMNPLTSQPDESYTMKAYMSDFDLVETMDIEVVAGRTPSADFPIDSVMAIGDARQVPEGEVVRSSIVINETAVQDFRWGSPAEAIGKEIGFAGGGNRIYSVIGVVEDFHNQSVHEVIEPTMIVYANEQTYFYVFVRIEPGNIPETMSRLRRYWDELLPDYAFEYTFLDQQFASLYRSDALVGSILGFFAILTVLIACLGLFGLASFTAQQRTKEIGVRKTLGASVGSIILLLSREFTGLVAAAFVVAIPVTLWAMNSWLGDFAYRIGLIDTWWVVAAAGLGAIAIALLTVSYQSARAALTDPVDALRYE